MCNKKTEKMTCPAIYGSMAYELTETARWVARDSWKKGQECAKSLGLCGKPYWMNPDYVHPACEVRVKSMDGKSRRVICVSNPLKTKLSDLGRYLGNGRVVLKLDTSGKMRESEIDLLDYAWEEWHSRKVVLGEGLEGTERLSSITHLWKDPSVIELFVL